MRSSASSLLTADAVFIDDSPGPRPGPGLTSSSSGPLFRKQVPVPRPCGQHAALAERFGGAGGGLGGNTGSGITAFPSKLKPPLARIGAVADTGSGRGSASTSASTSKRLKLGEAGPGPNTTKTAALGSLKGAPATNTSTSSSKSRSRSRGSSSSTSAPCFSASLPTPISTPHYPSRTDAPSLSASASASASLSAHTAARLASAALHHCLLAKEQLSTPVLLLRRMRQRERDREAAATAAAAASLAGADASLRRGGSTGKRHLTSARGKTHRRRDEVSRLAAGPICVV